MTPHLWQKFGGAALIDGAGVRRVGEIVAARLADAPAVVVSAHGGVTRLLRAAAVEAARGNSGLDLVRQRHKGLLRQLDLHPELLDAHLRELAGVLRGVRMCRRLGERELDYVLSFGERMSARVVAAALRQAGVPATAMDAFDLGLVSDSEHGRARPLPGFESEVRRALAGLDGVPVVTGFLARDARGALTTLGRNGSDLTAALLAEATGAQELEFWKTVGGILTADPRDVSEARTIVRMQFDQARELALHGAEVLHPESLLSAERSGATVRVRDVRDPNAPGTLLIRGVERGRRDMLSIASELTTNPRLDRRVAAITLVSPGGIALCRRGMECLEARGIEVLGAELESERPGQTLFVRPEARRSAVQVLHSSLLEATCPR